MTQPCSHNHTTHSTKSRTYQSWANMKSRCLDANNPNYPNYGGRGIHICDRWLEFSNFLEDMGDRPAGTSLDRTNNALGYSKDNCKWSTRRQQALNRRVQSNNSTGVTGVSFNKNGYRAYTTYMGKQINLGTYKTLNDASFAVWAYKQDDKKFDNTRGFQYNITFNKESN